MDISVLIVNWNAHDYLTQCFATLMREIKAYTSEIIVVNNSSMDETVTAIKNKYPEVKVITNSRNIGFACANNQALQFCSGEQILLLNPDTEIQPRALHRMDQFMTDHPEVGILGPRLLNSNRTLQTSCYPFPTLAREFWRLLHLDQIKPWGNYPQEHWSLLQPRDVDSLQGACLLIRREVFDQVGLLDEDYFMYTEEIDFCYRAKKAGWKIVWLPTAEVIHHGGQSTKQVASSMFVHLYQSKLLFFRKHYGRLAAWLYKVIILMATIIRLALTPFAWLEKLPKREQHLAMSRNYLRLLAALPGL